MSTETKYDVFISYSRKDIKEVKVFIARLKREIPSLTIWIDYNDIKPAEAYEEKIVSAIDSSKCVLLFASNHSMQSKHVKREISYAENVEKKVIPLLLNGSNLRTGLFLYKFGEINYIDTTNDIHINQLVDDLRDISNSNNEEPDPPETLLTRLKNYFVKHRIRVIYVSIIVLMLAIITPYVLVDKNKLFYVNGIFFDMIYVEGGTFFIRDNSEDKGKQKYNITLRDYYIGEAEVTQGLWRAVMGENPSFFRGERKPVECISYNDCMAFVKELNDLTKDSRPKGFEFRLPTEMEWEFAARGGVKRRDFKYSGSNDIATVAWHNEELINKDFGDNGISVKTNIKDTHNVCQKTCNELLLYDMSGNVWEWCYDWYADYSPNMNWQTDPQGPLYGKFKVLRGGSCSSNKENCNVTSRFYANPDTKDFTYGLRLVLGRQLKYNSNK